MRTGAAMEARGSNSITIIGFIAFIKLEIIE